MLGVRVRVRVRVRVWVWVRVGVRVVTPPVARDEALAVQLVALHRAVDVT